MSDILGIFSNLEKNLIDLIPKSPFTKEEEKQALAMFEKRKEFCVKDIHKAANMLDPRYCGKDIADEEHFEILQFILNMGSKLDKLIDASKLEIELGNYVAKSSKFANNKLWELAKTICPNDWWKAYNKHVSLGKLAISILNLPITTAAVERSFSTYSNIQTAKRNRLTIERAGKLVFIAQNQKFLSEVSQNEMSNLCDIESLESDTMITEDSESECEFMEEN